MSIQASPVIAPVCKEMPDINTHFCTATPHTKTKYSVLIFFRSLNPFNWFNEFSNIDITLEEFAEKKPYKKNS
jgi:hypothetical protein